MWKALLWKDLRANGMVLLALWGPILVIASLSWIESWREGICIVFPILMPGLVAGLLIVTLGISETASGTAPFLDGLPVSRRQVWGTKLLLMGLQLIVVALISLGLITYLIHSAPLLNEDPQEIRAAAVRGPFFLGLSLQTAAFVGLLGFACAMASTSAKQAGLRLLFGGEGWSRESF